MEDLQESYLLNPPRTRRRRRKSARSHKRTRTRRRRNVARKPTRKRGRRRNAWKGDRAGHRRAEKKGRRRKRRRSARRRNAPVRARSRRRVGRKRRRSRGGNWRANPGLLGAIPQVAPFKLPLPGIVGDIGNAVVNGVFGGALVFTGYLVSGVVVDVVCTKEDAAAALAADDMFKGKWLRPLLFSITSGLVGFGVGMIAPKGKQALWGALAASGSGIRAAAGVMNALIPTDATGVLANVRSGAAGLADYLQVEDYIQVDDAGVSDYLQVENGMGQIYEAGMGEEIYAGGMEEGFHEDEVIGI